MNSNNRLNGNGAIDVRKLFLATVKVLYSDLSFEQTRLNLEHNQVFSLFEYEVCYLDDLMLEGAMHEADLIQCAIQCRYLVGARLQGGVPVRPPRDVKDGHLRIVTVRDPAVAPNGCLCAISYPSFQRVLLGLLDRINCQVDIYIRPVEVIRLRSFDIQDCLDGCGFEPWEFVECQE